MYVSVISIIINIIMQFAVAQGHTHTVRTDRIMATADVLGVGQK